MPWDYLGSSEKRVQEENGFKDGPGEHPERSAEGRETIQDVVYKQHAETGTS